MKLMEPIILFVIQVFKKSLDAVIIACLNQLTSCKTKFQILSSKYCSQAYYT